MGSQKIQSGGPKGSKLLRKLHHHVDQTEPRPVSQAEPVARNINEEEG